MRGICQYKRRQDRQHVDCTYSPFSEAAVSHQRSTPGTRLDGVCKFSAEIEIAEYPAEVAGFVVAQ